MTLDERRRQVAIIINKLDEGFRALRESDDAVHAGTDVLRQMIDVHDRIYAAHTRAIDAALAANRAALDLLHQLDA